MGRRKEGSHPSVAPGRTVAEHLELGKVWEKSQISIILAFATRLFTRGRSHRYTEDRGGKSQHPKLILWSG